MLSANSSLSLAATRLTDWGPEWVLRWIKTAGYAEIGCYILLSELRRGMAMFRARFEAVTVECSNHFPHTQQFLPNTKLTLLRAIYKLDWTDVDGGVGNGGDRLLKAADGGKRIPHRPLMRSASVHQPESLQFWGYSNNRIEEPASIRYILGLVRQSVLIWW